MGSSPIPALFIVITSIVLQALLLGDDPLSSPTFTTFDADDFGGIDIIGDIISAILNAITFVFFALTWSLIDGVPWWIQYPAATLTIGSLVWAVAELLRGN